LDGGGYAKDRVRAGRARQIALGQRKWARGSTRENEWVDEPSVAGEVGAARPDSVMEQ